MSIKKRKKKQQQKNRLIRFLLGPYLQKSIISGSIRGTAIVLICCNCKAFTKMSTDPRHNIGGCIRHQITTEGEKLATDILDS